MEKKNGKSWGRKRQNKRFRMKMIKMQKFEDQKFHLPNPVDMVSN